MWNTSAVTSIFDQSESVPAQPAHITTEYSGCIQAYTGFSGWDASWGKGVYIFALPRVTSQPPHWTLANTGSLCKARIAGKGLRYRLGLGGFCWSWLLPEPLILLKTLPPQLYTTLPMPLHHLAQPYLYWQVLLLDAVPAGWHRLLALTAHKRSQMWFTACLRHSEPVLGLLHRLSGGQNCTVRWRHKSCSEFVSLGLYFTYTSHYSNSQNIF